MHKITLSGFRRPPPSLDLRLRSIPGTPSATAWYRAILKPIIQFPPLPIRDRSKYLSGSLLRFHLQPPPQCPRMEALAFYLPATQSQAPRVNSAQ